MLNDQFGRQINYIRVSITDRCNLRCVYCMPPEGVEWKPHDQILTFEEIKRVITLIADLGVRNVKVTGGEPLLRRGAFGFISDLRSIAGVEKITLTTNGILLPQYLDEVSSLTTNTLPDSINISLDALDVRCYKQITGVGDMHPQKIISVIDQLLEKQIIVKINCVPVREVNEDEVIPLAALAKDRNVIVRFIELMPTGHARRLRFISGNELAAKIEKTFGTLTPCNDISGSGPAVYYSLSGFVGKLGFINAVTHGFCESCNRLRLTCEGFLKLCLFNERGLDLRELIRTDANDDEIANAIVQAVKNKPAGFSKAGVLQESMSMIGG